MKKKLGKLLSLIIASVFSFCLANNCSLFVTAESIDFDDINYIYNLNTETGCVAIMDYEGESATAEIPLTVLKDGVSYNVTSIKECAFYFKDWVESVVFNKNIELIEGFAFYECSAIKSVTFLSKTTVIGENAFYYTPVAEIRGYKGSTAEAYAISHSIAFVDISPIRYVGAQLKTNSDSTYSIRFIAVVDNLSFASKVGFVLSQTTDTLDINDTTNCTTALTTSVRSYIIADSVNIYPSQYGGSYFVVITISGLTSAQMNTLIYYQAVAKLIDNTYFYYDIPHSTTLSYLLS